jgi:hypothetical protein
MSENSNFLGSGQPAPNTQSSTAPLKIDGLCSAGDAAKIIGTSITTVKRIATGMRMDVIRTIGGLWLFTEYQVAKIKAERERRRVEALK